MKRQTDPYMVQEDDDDDDGTDSPKRPRVSASALAGGRFSGGGGFSGGDGHDVSAELQLEAMLAAEGGGKPFGAHGGGKGFGGAAGGMGKGPGAGGFGMPPGLGVAGLSRANPLEPRVETTPMDFSRLSQNQPSRQIPVPKNLVEFLMTPEHRGTLTEETGADVEWAPEEAQVKLRGSAEQVKKATRLLQRVLMHCHWGRSEAKVSRLLKPRIVESAICRLSPMNTLRPAEKILSGSQAFLTIGKEKTNDVVIQDPIISRQHCVLELDPERGAVYAIDCSTNGTFLNGIRLPSKTIGKVLVSHGDELLFKDPAGGDLEFGYIVNLNELHVRPSVKLEPPRRLLTPEELSNTNRDFS